MSDNLQGPRSRNSVFWLSGLVLAAWLLGLGFMFVQWGAQ